MITNDQIARALLAAGNDPDAVDGLFELSGGEEQVTLSQLKLFCNALLTIATERPQHVHIHELGKAEPTLIPEGPAIRYTSCMECKGMGFIKVV